jgi:two-component system LytT family response regulator
MISALIIEDEFAAFAQLNNFIIKNFIHDVEIIGHAKSVKEGIKLITELKPQLIFLDIQLEDGLGFDILDHFKSTANFEVIFTTGLKDYKEKAMDYFAFYYLNKPIQEEQFTQVLNTFLLKKSNFNLKKYATFKSQIETQNQKIALPENNGDFIFVDLNDIIYCEAEGSYTLFYTANDKKYTSSNNLKKIENILGQNSFFRIHRSYLLNLKHIKKYNVKGEITLSNNKKLVVSSRNRKNFMNILRLFNFHA